MMRPSPFPIRGPLRFAAVLVIASAAGEAKAQWRGSPLTWGYFGASPGSSESAESRGFGLEYTQHRTAGYYGDPLYGPGRLDPRRYLLRRILTPGLDGAGGFGPPYRAPVPRAGVVAPPHTFEVQRPNPDLDRQGSTPPRLYRGPRG